MCPKQKRPTQSLLCQAGSLVSMSGSDLSIAVGVIDTYTRSPQVYQIGVRFLKLASAQTAYTRPSRTRHPMTAKASAIAMQRILLAEDDSSMRAFLERALVKAGYEVMSFENGADALERLKEEPFSLLLTDIVMPRMDGIELARRASELDPELKIMFITGFAAVTLNNESRPPKDARVLSKPFHLKDLVHEVGKLLAA